MSESALLDMAGLPATIECVVRRQVALPLAQLELHDYRFHGAQKALFRSERGFLDLALSHRPGRALGRYVDTPGHPTVPLGDVMFIPGGHAVDSQWGAGRQSSICCQFEPGRVDEHGWSDSDLDASLDLRNAFIRDALARLAREIETPGFCSELMAEAICTQIAIELGRHFRGHPQALPAITSRLSAAQIRQIEERLDTAGKTPSVSELAAGCGLSTRHFFRMFRAATGTTLSDYAAARRIARAKALLSDRTPRVKEIAYRCGFETQAAFSAAFRRVTGVTPRAYRQQVAQ